MRRIIRFFILTGFYFLTGCQSDEAINLAATIPTQVNPIIEQEMPDTIGLTIEMDRLAKSIPPLDPNLAELRYDYWDCFESINAPFYGNYYQLRTRARAEPIRSSPLADVRGFIDHYNDGGLSDCSIRNHVLSNWMAMKVLKWDMSTPFNGWRWVDQCVTYGNKHECGKEFFRYTTRHQFLFLFYEYNKSTYNFRYLTNEMLIIDPE